MHDAKNLCDGAIWCAIVGMVMGWLPIIAPLCALILTLMRIVIEWPAFKSKLKAIFSRRRK